MNIAVLIPYRPEDAEREANFERTMQQWRYPVYTAAGPEGPFSRAAAINQAAIKASDADAFVIADSDLLIEDPDQIALAADLCLHEGVYVVAFGALGAFDWAETKAVRAGANPASQPMMEYHQRLWGGIFAVPRGLFNRAGGFDEGFVGWGYEDGAFLAACSTLAGGKERIPGNVYHLRHTDAPRVPELMQANSELAVLYRDAEGDRSKMEALIESRRL